MFFTALISDSIPLEPSQLSLDLTEVLTLLLLGRYVDKVIPNVGLVVGLYDIMKVKECIVHPGDGRIHYKLDIRLIVFKPFKGEVLDAIVIGSDPSGLQLSMEFFQDIKINQSRLRDPKGFDAEEKLWWWEFDGHRLYYETNQLLRFRVADVSYPQHENKTIETQKTTYQPPMMINGAADGDGLGMKSWWE